MPRTVDTRFFLTHFLAETDDLKTKTTKKIIELQRENAVVPTIVLHEVYKFMHDHVGKEVAQLRVNSIINSRFQIIDLNTEIALASATLRCRYRNLPTADSVVAGTSMETKSRRVITDDPHFREVEEIHSEWL